MAFPRSVGTRAISEFVIRRFLWDRRGKAFPPSPFPKDFRSLCSDFDLAMAEQAAATMSSQNCRRRSSTWPLLSCARERLSRGSGCSVIESMRLGSARIVVRTKSQGPVIKGRPRVGERQPMMRPLKGDPYLAFEECLAPISPLSEDFNVLCPCFSLAAVEAAAVESELPEIVLAMFYAMLLNNMLELGAIHKYTTEKKRSLLVGLRWSTFEVWMRIMDEVIRGVQLHRQPDEVEVKGVCDG
ncbi:hypothetical protein Cgig2_032918 [Carnegiea gigantea]|uniref:Uncharacterized protein n=1 Tax=Carnegiea gigantea TaxID=171969 RepID=A0A9Q1QBC3_9CARY|nr:hypothetical protein Cgig2_032918 [Carnegiea gigantea]